MKPSLLLSLCTSLLAHSAQAESKRVSPTPERRPASIQAEAAGTACVPTAAKVQVRLHLEGGTLAELAREVARHTCRNLNLDPRWAHEQVWFTSGAGIPADQLWTVFLDLLASRDLTLVTTDHHETVVRSADAVRSTVPFYSDGQSTPSENRMITKVLRPRTKDLNATTNFLNIFKSNTAQLHPYPAAGILVVTDYAPNVARLERILAETDRSSSHH